jgi:hypothetical protein
MPIQTIRGSIYQSVGVQEYLVFTPVFLNIIPMEENFGSIFLLRSWASFRSYLNAGTAVATDSITTSNGIGIITLPFCPQRFSRSSCHNANQPATCATGNACVFWNPGSAQTPKAPRVLPARRRSFCRSVTDFSGPFSTGLSGAVILDPRGSQACKAMIIKGCLPIEEFLNGQGVALARFFQGQEAAANRSNHFRLAADYPTSCVCGGKVGNRKGTSIRSDHIFHPRSNLVGHGLLTTHYKKTNSRVQPSAFGLNFT